uniref:J domain-containing protein n=1 Tax=Timema poppense TaxID=170557 RepID=A0A7R9CKZ5_TIMPO|nr:unnamed protein product [Timema poppensis]
MEETNNRKGVESGKSFRETPLSAPVQDSNLNLPAFGSLVQHESSVLDHAATEADCDQEDVRQAFLKLAKRFHPDSASPEADSVKFNLIEEAYRKLNNKFAQTRLRGNGDNSDFDCNKNKAVKEFDIKHTAPQHRQYLSYGGYGYGSPQKREKQFMKHRADVAINNIYNHRVSKLSKYVDEVMVVKDKKESKKIKISSEIDRLVEDLIQESMAKGDFDHLSGKGKPLPYKNTNPYVDFVTQKMNEVLIENGFTPEWITLQKEIREELHILRETSPEDVTFNVFIKVIEINSVSNMVDVSNHRREVLTVPEVGVYKGGVRLYSLIAPVRLLLTLVHRAGLMPTQNGLDSAGQWRLPVCGVLSLVGLDGGIVGMFLKYSSQHYQTPILEMVMHKYQILPQVVGEEIAKYVARMGPEQRPRADQMAEDPWINQSKARRGDELRKDKESVKKLIKGGGTGQNKTGASVQRANKKQKLWPSDLMPHSVPKNYSLDRLSHRLHPSCAALYAGRRCEVGAIKGISMAQPCNIHVKSIIMTSSSSLEVVFFRVVALLAEASREALSVVPMNN